MSTPTKAGFIMEICNHKDDIANLRRTKTKLEQEIRGLQTQRTTARDYLANIDNGTRRIISDLQEIGRERKSLETLDDYFIDAPAVIPETRHAWGVLADELRQASAKIEKWLSSLPVPTHE